MRLAMEALQELHRERRDKGWTVQVYDYTANSWFEGEEAFERPGTYERAVLRCPGKTPVRVRVLPSGGGGLSLDVGSAMGLGTWRALGIELRGRHLDLIGTLLGDRTGQVTIDELAGLLAASDDDLAAEVLEALSPLVHAGGDAV